MYPDGRCNPTPSHFARKTPVEIHPPVSPRLLRQRNLDREGRAICRIVYASGMGVQFIAKIFCVSEDTVIQAIENNAGSKDHDKAEHDYFYVNNEYRNQYPSHGGRFISKSLPKKTGSIDDTQARRSKQLSTSNPDRNGGRHSQSKTKKPSGGAQQTTGASDHAGIAGNNPSCHHFRDNIPIARVHSSEPNYLIKLDRKGRAICRITYPYLESYTKIAYIFGITHTRVRKAVLNDYVPPDDTEEDYEHAGQEFKDEYPPLSIAPVTDSGKRQRSPELDEVGANKRAKKSKIAAKPAAKVSRLIPIVELPARATVDAGAVGIRSFLKNIGGFDLSKWQETFKQKGLRNMDDLSTLACLEEGKLVKTLTRLFAGSDQKMAEVHILLLTDALLDLAKDVKGT